MPHNVPQIGEIRRGAADLPDFSRLMGVPERLRSMSDLDLRTMTRPLTVFVTAHAPATASFGRWQAQDLFPMLDEFSTAPLELVETEADAQFIIEVIATPSEGVTSLLMRESIVVMAAARIAADDDLKVQQSIAARFAKMIDTAAECYAAPSSVSVPA